MSQPDSTLISHDAAARVLKLTPAELEQLVSAGAVSRVARDAYALIPLVHSYIDHLRAEAARVLQRPTQAEIGAHLDISDRRVRELAVEWGVDSRALTLGEWRLRYLRKLREEAAGRAARGDLDLATERARLAKEQADRLEMQNAVTRNELAPVEAMEEILARTGTQVARQLATIPGQLLMRCPKLTADDVASVDDVLIKTRNLAAGMTLSSLYDDEADESADDEARPDVARPEEAA